MYVVSFRGGQGKWQISQNGGNGPSWSADGKELYFANLSYTVFAVPVKQLNGNTLQFGTSQPLVSNTSSQLFFFDLTPDGKKILLNVISQQVNQSITVVTNWTEELKK